MGLEAKRGRVLGVRETRAREEEEAAEADMVSSFYRGEDKVCLCEVLGF